MSRMSLNEEEGKDRGQSTLRRVRLSSSFLAHSPVHLHHPLPGSNAGRPPVSSLQTQAQHVAYCQVARLSSSPLSRRVSTHRPIHQHRPLVHHCHPAHAPIVPVAPELSGHPGKRQLGQPSVETRLVPPLVLERVREDDASGRRKLGLAGGRDCRIEVGVGLPRAEEELDPVMVELRMGERRVQKQRATKRARGNGLTCVRNMGPGSLRMI